MSAEYSAGEEKRTSGTQKALIVVALVVALGVGAAIGHFATGINDEQLVTEQPVTAATEPAKCERNGWVPKEERSPMDFRRTTLCVYNMTRSLEFYQHGLGMTKIYDSIIKTPSNATTIHQADKWRRLVFLRGNNERIGVLGLYEYIKPRMGAEIRNPNRDFSSPDNQYFRVGDIVLVYTSFEPVTEQLNRIMAVDNVYVAESTQLIQFPGYNGDPVKLTLTTVVDPDGNLVEINHIMSGYTFDD